MSGLADYLEQLRMRQESLQNTISELGQTLIRLELIRRLEAIAQRIREWEAGFVIDREGPLLLRSACVWAVIGPGGIPDDVEVVGESVSLWGDFGEVCQPDLKGFHDQGKLVIAGKEFLDLLVELKEEVRAGHLYRGDEYDSSFAGFQ